MTAQPLRLAGLVGVAALILLAGCGLPRSGPTKSELSAASGSPLGDALVIAVDDRVIAATASAGTTGFGAAFTSAGVVGSDTIRPGDTLGLRVWENVEDGLLAPAGATSAVLDEIQVAGDGFIYVPYAGRIRAAGNSPEAVRRIITDRLAEQTPDPQVTVRRLGGDGATVSLVGGVGAQGVYPIERPTRTLSAMLARAGGVTLSPETAQVTVLRGGTRGRVWLQDLYADARNDIALRGGDRVLVEQDERSFTALGATGKQARVPFETRTISAIEAIATVGGLNPALADPTGIFVLRTEPAAVARALTGRPHAGPQRVAYVLDISRPQGMFTARDFQIRDGDTVYVTEAPYSQFAKIVTSVAAPLNSAASIDRLTN